MEISDTEVIENSSIPDVISPPRELTPVSPIEHSKSPTQENGTKYGTEENGTKYDMSVKCAKYK